MAVEIPIIFGTAALISAPLVMPIFDIYRRQFVNGRKYPNANLGFLPVNTSVILEDEARTHVRYLMDQSKNNLYVSTSRLSATVWDKDLAKTLQEALGNNPQLKVHLLTGRELIGLKDGYHPFYEACRDLAAQDRVRLAVHDGRLPLEGVLSDHKNVYRVYRGSESERGELVPALWTYEDYDSYTALGTSNFFSIEFENLWNKADHNSRPTIKAT